MTQRVIAALPHVARPYLESQLPDWVDVRWFHGKDEALVAGVEASIGWFDLGSMEAVTEIVRNAPRLKWLFSLLAGVDGMPLTDLAKRNIVFTNSPGLAAPTVSEYVLLGMLSIAKGYRAMVQAQGRHEWLANPPGTLEIMGTRALVIGYGALGQAIESRLKAFDIAVTVVRRTPDASGHALAPNQWRERLGEFDWVIVVAPATVETIHMFGADEFKAMKQSAVLLNFSRGSLVDQAALVSALQNRDIGGAFLDVTDPEPLPPDHVLWTLDNVHISMHLSGRSQTMAIPRASQRFLENLARFRDGRPLLHQVDLTLGY